MLTVAPLTDTQLTVAQLAADPSLGLGVAAGARSLARPITAAAVSELTRPGSWLQGGELLLTIGLLLPEDGDGCTAYVADLCAADVRALGLGLGADLRYQRAPESLVRATEAAGLPLLTVPDGIPFIAVTKAVFAYRARQERHRLEWALQTQRALTAAAVQPGGLAGILTTHRDATGRTGVVLDVLGRTLAESGTDNEPLVHELTDLVDAVRQQGLLGAAVDVTPRRRREVHPLGAHRIRGLLLLDGPVDCPGSNLVTGDLVSLLSLELERQIGVGGAERRDRAQILRRLAMATVDDLIAVRWLTSVGLTDADLRAAVVAAPRAEELAADLATAIPGALLRVERSDDGDDLVEMAAPVSVDLPAALRTLARDRPAGIGIGVRPGALAVSLRQARSALPTSRVSERHMYAEEMASSRLLLSQVTTEQLDAYCDAVLGPLDAAPKAAELIRALTSFLEHNGHWEATAEALRVHRHTVRNRLDAVESLTGRRMSSAQDRQELWLALTARDLTRVVPGSDARRG